jgi:glutaredoxin-related protein
MTIIVFDFDGVLAEAGEWEGHSKIGPPKDHWLGVIRRLHKEGIECKIMTCRLNPNPFSKQGFKGDPEVLSGFARAHLVEWLENQEIFDCIKEISGWKVYGDLYVDDRMPMFDVLDEDEPEEIYAKLLEELAMRERK